MKKFILLIIFISLDCIISKETVAGRAVVKKEFATEELAAWFGKFSYDPIFSEMMDSIKKEYPKLLKDIALIKSGAFKGLSIDFVGMVHFVSNPNVEEAKMIRRSQSSVKKLIGVKKYDYIGSENFSVQGIVNYDEAIFDQKYNVSQLLRIARNIKYTPSTFQTEEMLRSFSKEDFVYEMVVNRVQKPVIIGTEPRWVWLLEQLIRDTKLSSLPPSESIELKKLLPILSNVRSEIAFVRTAKFLKNNGKGKRAAIVYGSNHLKHFEILRDKCLIKGELLSFE